jgi:hypothetical protein
LNSQAVANGDIGRTLFSQLQSSRSLLETDKAEPNTWFALSSTELFLNISVDLATEEEFPVIQLTDSSHTVIIPHDLREGTTDLIINGLRMKTQSRERLEKEFLRTYGSENAVDAFKMAKGTMSKVSGVGDSPITTGPYPFTTYLPLFLRGWSEQKIYARLGESRDDLLIGFVPHQAGEYDGPKSRRARWSEGHTQVVLEDRDLDFAWSLSCFVQGDELACHLPTSAIRQVYEAYFNTCPASEFCPGGKASGEYVQLSLSKMLPRSDGTAKESSAQIQTVRTMASQISFLGKKDQAGGLASSLDYLAVPTLQAWVVQFDTDDDQVFYSAEPARIDFFPLSDSYWRKGTLKAWQFGDADPEKVKVRGCNYFPAGGATNGVELSKAEGGHFVVLLGSLFGPDHRPLVPEPDSEHLTCQTFEVPTVALTRNQLVFKIDSPPTSHYPTPMSIPTYKLGPAFSESDVEPHFPALDKKNSLANVQPDGWTVDFLVRRSICGDAIEKTDPRIKFEWFVGDQGKGAGKSNCPALDDRTISEWRTEDTAERIRLQVTIPREALLELPEEIKLVRKSAKYGNVVVAHLPSLRRLLLPSELRIEPISPTQFVLRGENAEAVNAVALQNGGTARIFTAAQGVGFSLVTLPAASAGGAGDSSGNSTPAPGETLNKTTFTKDKNSVHVDVSESSKPPAKPAAPAQAKKPNQPAAEDPLAAGTYTVLPLIQVGEKSVTTVQATPAAPTTPGASVAPATPGVSGTPAGRAGSPATGATAPGGAGAGAKPAAQKIKTVTTKTPVYEPIPVRDVQGKPLLFTVADPKKAAAKPDATTAPAACAVPCIVQGCTTSLCPPAAPKPATSATP